MRVALNVVIEPIFWAEAQLFIRWISHGISGSPRLKRPPISQGLTRPESQLMVAAPKNDLERTLIFVLPWSTGVMIPNWLKTTSETSQLPCGCHVVVIVPNYVQIRWFKQLIATYMQKITNILCIVCGYIFILYVIHIFFPKHLDVALSHLRSFLDWGTPLPLPGIVIAEGGSAVDGRVAG